ncbi:MAG TPA: hypothetical protein VGO13_12915 [Solirubrobacterales bacterium]|jgi:hypothetical protein|nr:hypothetical protein [Solirubrobacterales bacterium]
MPIDDDTSVSLSRRQWIVLTGFATIAFWVALGIIERGLPSGTPGIVALEFVRNADRANRFLVEWGADGRDMVRLSLIVDYGFMVSYGAFVTLAGLATATSVASTASRRSPRPGASSPGSRPRPPSSTPARTPFCC